MDVVRLRWMAIKLGIEKIVIRNKKMICYFISDQDSSYYQSSIFSKVLNFVQREARKVQMKEEKNKLSLSINHVNSIEKAIGVLNNVLGAQYWEVKGRFRHAQPPDKIKGK